MIDDILNFTHTKFKKGALKPEYFNQYNRIILKILLDYWERYKHAPGTNIQNLFKDRKDDFDNDTAGVLEAYLDRFAEEHILVNDHQVNVDFFKKEVIPKFIEKQCLEELINKIQLRHDLNDFEEIKNEIKRFSEITDSEEEDECLGTVIPGNVTVIKKFFQENRLEKNNLFMLPGQIGRLIGPFRRGGLYAITGTEKGGKTHMMLEIGYQGLIFNRLKVLDISLEMQSDDKMIRFWQRMGHYALDKYTSGKQLIPVFDCQNNQYGTCKVKDQKPNSKALLRSENDEVEFYERPEWKICTDCRKNTFSIDSRKIQKNKKFIPAIWFREIEIKPITERRILSSIKRFRHFGLKNYRIKSFPRFMASFDDIDAYINDYIKISKFIPDVIILDYPDIMRPIEGKILDRHNIDYNWKSSALLAQKLNAAVIIADQTKKEARNSQSISRIDTSEDKRKDAHIDLRITLNKTDQEDQRGLQRIGTLFKRKGKTYNYEVMALQNLITCNPLIDSEIWFQNNLYYPTTNMKID